MDAKTLAKIVQIVVQEEVSKIVKKELTAMKKQIVAEVKKSIPKQIVNEKVTTNSYESLGNINDFDIPDVLPSKPIQKQKQLVKDPVLNSILNETRGFGEYEDYPTMGGNTLDSNQAQGVSNTSNFRAMMAEKMGMSGMTQPGKPSVQEMMPTVNPEGMPMRTQEVPDAVAKALTRDYTDLVKAMNKK